MNSLLDFIYILFFVPCDTFLYLSLFIIGVISLYIIVRQSRRISEVDLEEASSRLPAAQQERQLPYPLYNDEPPIQTSESETAPTENENGIYEDQDQTHQDSPETSYTSTSIHNTPPPDLNPPQVIVYGSHDDSLLEAGSVFANDNHNSYHSSPLSYEANHDGGSSTSSLDLNE